MTRWVFVEVWDTLSAILVTCVNVNKLVFQQKQSTIFKKKEGRKKKAPNIEHYLVSIKQQPDS